MQGQSVTLAALLLTHYLLNSVLAIEPRTPTHPATPCRCCFASTLTLLVLHCLSFLPPQQTDIYQFHLLPLSNKVILTPESINLKANGTKELLKFRLQGQNYIRYKALIKKPKYIKQRTLPIQLQGKDLQLKDSDALITFYYYYIYKKLNKKQELSIILSGRSIALTYLVEDHNIDKVTGLLRKRSESILTRPTIKDYPTKRSLIQSYNFNTFKQLLVQQIAYCYIAFF